MKQTDKTKLGQPFMIALLLSFFYSWGVHAQTDFLAEPDAALEDGTNDELWGDGYDDDDDNKQFGHRQLALPAPKTSDFDQSKKSSMKSTPTSLTKEQTDQILKNMGKNATGLTKKALQAGTGIGTLVEGLTDKPAAGILKKIDDKALIQLTKTSVNIIFKDFFAPDDGLIPAIKSMAVKSVLDWALIDQQKPKKPSFWDKTKVIAKKSASLAKNALFEVGSTVAKKTVSSSIQVFKETGKGWSKLFIDAAIAFAVMSAKAAIIAAIAV